MPFEGRAWWIKIWKSLPKSSENFSSSCSCNNNPANVNPDYVPNRGWQSIISLSSGPCKLLWKYFMHLLDSWIQLPAWYIDQSSCRLFQLWAMWGLPQQRPTCRSLFNDSHRNCIAYDFFMFNNSWGRQNNCLSSMDLLRVWLAKYLVVWFVRLLVKTA